MNLLAGILIGAIAPNWMLRIMIPFIWALLFVGYKWIKTKIKFNTKVIIVEYMTAAITSLLLSLLIGSIVELVGTLL